MAHLSTKVILYLKENGKTEIEFRKETLVDGVYKRNLELEDIGEGAYIKHWNIPDLSKPTDEQLAALDSQGNIEEANAPVYDIRKEKYGSWQEQLDEIYHNIDNWKARIQQIKSENPKT